MRAFWKIAACALVLGCIAFVLLSNDLRKDEETIRAALLREKPLGTPLAEVARWLATDKKLHVTKQDKGFLKQIPPPAVLVGAKSIETVLGQYRSPLPTGVRAYWGFNERDELIDVWIWKTIDIQ